LQKEFDLLMLQKEGELAQENLTAEEKAKIEDKYAKKAAVIKTKQAKAERRAAIISSLINTAAGIVKTLANLGLPAAIPGMIAAGIAGAVQTGIIASQKIPEFAKGTTNAPDNFIAGEKGRELLSLRTGEVILANEPTHFKGNKYKGATIKRNSETEKIIAQAERQNTINFDTESLRNEQKRSTARIVKAINSNNYRHNKAISQSYKERFL
jgi:hypothetical protein